MASYMTDPITEKTLFSSLDLDPLILRAIEESGYS